MIRMVGIGLDDTVLDIGCGDGRVCIAATNECGARSIGLESLQAVYERAVKLREECQFRERIELYQTSFMEPNNSILIDAIDRASVIFIFLLPTDMDTILQLIAESIQRKYAALKRTQSSSSLVPISSSFSASPTSSSSLLCPCPCPCPSSLRTRVASWTFSLPAYNSAFALPIQPTRSIALQSEQTKLHIYEFCACQVQYHQQHQQKDGHAYWINKVFAPNSIPSTSSSITSPSSVSSQPSTTSPSPFPFNLSHIRWGHAVNTIPSLVALLASAGVDGVGVFIECDLRLKPSSSSSSSMISIDDVILAHDAGSSGPTVREWFEALLQCHQQHAVRRGIGLKFDFKQIEAVEATLVYLKEQQTIGRWFQQSHPAITSEGEPQSSPSSSSLIPSFPFIWLNADVLPSASLSATPIAGDQFIQICRSHLPHCVFSLGWTTASDGIYTHRDIDAMLQLIDRYDLHQLTFPLRASRVKRSWEAGTIQRLLAHCANSTVTIWTSKVDQQKPEAAEEENWIKQNLPTHRTFIDLVL